MINVTNLNKYYNKGKSNEIHVINNTNLVLPNTGFIVFLGASGSGKTTLINVIAGLDKAKGEISYDEATFKNYKMGKIDKFRRDNIGYVFQNYNLIPNMTVYDNVKLPLELMGINNNEEIKERIDYVLKMLNMDRFKNKLASNLSGGQMQRVSIARALVKDSKIIIADEPTGNLDSENTIEVMNILKAISKTRLVIMVTHDKKSANFYADRIVEIKDGIVENDYENDGTNELDNYDKTKIYLKDLENKTLEVNGIKINLYLEANDNIEDLNLTLVKKDGRIYLKSDSVNYVNDDSKVKLIDENYKAIKKEDVESFEFNPKPFSEQKKHFTLKPFLHSIAQAYRAHRASSKKMKGLHVCFILIGVVMAVCVLMLSVGTYVRSDQIDYSDTGLVYKRGDVGNYITETKKLIDEGLIVDTSSGTSVNYYSSVAGHVQLTNTCYEFNYSYISDSMIEGVSTCGDGEIIITKRIADAIIKKMSNIEKLNYKSLLNSMVNGKTVVGITNSTSTTFYTNETTFNNYDNLLKSYDFINDSYSVEYYKNFNYEVVGGRDVEAPNECLVNINYHLSYDTIPSSIYIDGTEYNVVGYYDCNNGDEGPNLIVYNNDLVKRNYELTTCFGTVPASIFKDKLIDGRLPEKENEIIVSNFYDENLNCDAVNCIKDNRYEIVGHFSSNGSTLCTAIGINDNIFLYNKIKYPSENNVIVTTNDDLVIERLKNVGVTLKTSYNYEHDLNVKQKQEMFGSTITVSMVFLVITVIYTFFMMRSKMIHRIYEIGVLREIGASKGRIYRTFFAELLVLVFMTTMIGYLGSLILSHLANRKIHGLLNLFRYSPVYAIGGFVILLVVSIISGMLPIFTLQRKTPAEIVSKYDL